MAKAHRKKVPETVKKAIKDELKEPQLAELASYWFGIAGGPRQVAKILYEEFRAAKPGSLIRQRILDMVLRVVKYANDKSGSAGDLGLLSDEDLQREVADLVSEMKAGEAVADAKGPTVRTD